MEMYTVSWTIWEFRQEPRRQPGLPWQVFYNWTFVPYAMYAVSGLLIAYMYFNKKEKLSVISTLKPLLGKKAEHPAVMNTVDTLCSLAITLGMASGLGTGLALIISGLECGI